ncbi:Flagellar basal-body rod protein FlgG [Pseudovibrio sp. Ad13]|jgi:flagellar basal-body rod protein FlgF|uniref:Flagellar basal-body rod protein FlgF n=1 Tax=Pseudovibrio ascidiaceicola TaxID=285279 RepID=A0A1I4CBY6_9HYPH|nr:MULTISPECIES: flagellar basal-body rod protein FlgF [Pseudovibrio]KZK77655.1 Flagellar basal-body rod protein FlgG [Pseudovibrio sp. Ad46]KZK81383.1 Flagellar basal-body rod protein FlgG [Pseudovibrio sp. Ad13]KZK93526.1 Flagellar basal-body rod protein FlgG [Pseudovibrio sp. Ad5]KZL14878.1 Flagellar basal-body rod protein FlgG [Pseudovibrio sp. Ad37]KZL23119.1 Flagellar basal-body rod protein FlgG [Pseudovibrio sp. WM33]
MENAQLIGLSRQSALRRNLDVVANNLANINTTGYKAQRLIFEEFLMPTAQATEFQRPDRPLSFTQDVGTATVLTQGSIQLTGNPLDVAIEGDGYLAVTGAGGEQLYTRSGSLAIDPEGTLVTDAGLPVLADGAPIQINPEDGEITITKEGVISTPQAQLGRLDVYTFDNRQELLHVGTNLFSGLNPIPANNPTVVQGALEGSNVEGIQEISRMIEITRQYKSVSKMMSQRNELRQRSIRELGSVEA